MTEPAAPRLGVIGAEHLHLIEIVDALVAAGATSVAHVPDGSLIELYASWRTDSEPRTADEILHSDDIDIVVTAGVPATRAEVIVAALQAGKAVVSAKPAVTGHAQLAEIAAALHGRPGRPFTVVFTERFANRAVLRAIELVQQGAIGKVVRIVGSGPHTLAAATRPDWFFEPAMSGGILVDLASHQIDEFLACTGDPPSVEVVAASVGNVANPDRPQCQDIGALTVVADGVEGHLSVDLLSPAGLGTWGDVRLAVTGTSGTLEVRANIDVTGEPGEAHLIHVDADRARRIDTSTVSVDWARVLLDDLADATEVLMTQAHVLGVCALACDAQSMATSWGGAP